MRRLGRELSDAYEDGVVLVAVLKGSVPFLADLVRSLSIVPVVDFLAISSYGEGTGRVRIVKDLDLDVYGRDVVLVEDVVDTGLTLTYVLGELERRQPRSLEVCTLLDKPECRKTPFQPKYTGFQIANEFVVGFGLDYDERYRQLPYVGVLTRKI